MKRFGIFLAKTGIILYLASQAFIDYDILVLLWNWLTGGSVKLPYGINAGNALVFAIAAVFIARKELKRSNKIGYSYSPESLAFLKSNLDSGDASPVGGEFGALLGASLKSIVGQRFPPMIPLQFSDILTTKGFELQEEESDGLLQYVEDLSPLEVATDAALNWIRQEAQFKRFRLELHFESDYEAVTINSGNPDTNAYLCLDSKPADVVGSSAPRLASEAALRMFFESESQICQDFEAFKRFYKLVEELPSLYSKFGSSEFDEIHADLIERIDMILECDPRFLTMQVLKGIVFFHHRNKSIQAFEQAAAIFEEAIENAKTYNGNRKRARRSSVIPSFLRKSEGQGLGSEPKISRRTMYYVQGLSEIFLARIFSQNAHRFGSYDADPKRFLRKRREARRRVNRGIRLLNAARRRVPMLSRFFPVGAARIPQAYHVKGLIQHCHDFYDKDEVFFRNPKRQNRESDSVNDLRKAIKVYEKGIALCGQRKIGGSESYALHSGTRIHNNCGYARLYACLIQGKLNTIPLRDLPDFEEAEFGLYYSGFESETFFGYPLANLGLLYALEGDWERSWKAGVAALDKRIYLKAKEALKLQEGQEANAWEYSTEKVAAYRDLLIQAVEKMGFKRPSIDRPTSPDWSYVEGISELSYGFFFRSLCKGHSSSNKAFLEIGLLIHRRALDQFAAENMEATSDYSESELRRIKNIMTNLIRAFWHFDDRSNEVESERMNSIRDSLHVQVEEICRVWDRLDAKSENWPSVINASIEEWISALADTLGEQ